MATVLFYMFAAILMIIANKWVLLKTTTPLFFLLAQLLIAVVTFALTATLGLFKLSLKLDWAICKGLWPMIVVNVIGLRSVLASL
jgi:GDP-fucose transporter C1